MTIYLDIIMFLCFIFNGAILFLVSYVVKQKQSIIKWLSGTLLATLFVPIVLYFPESIFNSILGKVVFSIGIILVTFGGKRIDYLIKNLLTFYIISFLVGGAIISIHYLIEYSTNNSYKRLLFYVDNMYHNEVSLIVMFAGLPLTLLITKMWSDKLLVHEFMNQQQFTVELQFNNRVFRTNAFLDSGNHVVDPLTNRPVIICDAHFVTKFFNVDEWREIKYSIEVNDPQHIPSYLANKFVIIPIQTVADSHYLYTIKPDKLKIEINKRRIVTNKVLVGIQLSSITSDNAYHCLLQPQLIALYPTENVS